MAGATDGPERREEEPAPETDAARERDDSSLTEPRTDDEGGEGFDDPVPDA